MRSRALLQLLPDIFLIHRVVVSNECKPEIKLLEKMEFLGSLVVWSINPLRNHGIWSGKLFLELKLLYENSSY